jgi:hypothetical protein
MPCTKTVEMNAVWPESSSFGNPVYSSWIATGETRRRFEIFLVAKDAERAIAESLVNKMYGWRGYGNQHKIPVSPAHTTFLACLDRMPTGTLSYANDSRAGLAADNLFRDEIDEYRRVPGTRVSELSRFAFDAAMPSQKLLASLVHVIFLHNRCHNPCTDIFIEVNPRHVRFYEAMIGFRAIGAARKSETVGAPSQLMHLRNAEMAERISAPCTSKRGAGRSLYSLFLSPADQDHVQARFFPQAEAA